MQKTTKKINDINAHLFGALGIGSGNDIDVHGDNDLDRGDSGSLRITEVPVNLVESSRKMTA